MKLALDANCFINAMNPQALSSGPLRSIFAAQSSGQVELHVSLHTLHELEQKPDEALELARKLPILPYWPIGTIGDLVGTIGEMTGTFGDMQRNDAIEEELRSLAKSGNNLRDRGAFIDALHAFMDAFVTDDRQLVDRAPAKRIFDRFRMRIMRPQQAMKLIADPNLQSEATAGGDRNADTSELAG